MSKGMTKESLRNLVQYRDLSEEDFEKVWNEYSTGVVTNKEFENRIKDKINEFSKDYDLDDLKANDMLTLRALAQAYITLEDYERYSYIIRTEEKGIDLDRIYNLDKMSNIMSNIRKDISSMQTDLDITRKVRKGDKESNLINELEDLKRKANEFYRERMFYVWCPKCKTLLFTGWFLYPEEPRNRIRLVCNRKLEDGSICGETLLIGSKELLENRGVNIEDVPEYFK